MNTSIQRRRLACAECTRRKIKCDKVLPCRNCTRRGSACYRNVRNASHRYTTSPPRARPQSADVTVLQENLTSCIHELQTTLQAVRDSQSSTPNFNDSAVSIGGTLDPEPNPVPYQSENRRSPASLQTEPLSSNVGNAETAEVEDAATILEFLAWGRRKGPTFDDGLSAETSSRPALSPGDVVLDDNLDSADSPQLRLTDESSLAVIQLLLPEPDTLLQIVKYHCECLLWYHASFHAIVLQKEVNNFLDKHKYRIDRPGLDLQWVAFLFAVLTGSMTCAPAPIAYSWGFHDQECSNIARRWFKAALICLNRADFTACHSIYAVQCIATMTISAHMLGHSNSHSVMLSAAVRISQSLGLHRLGSPAKDSEPTIVRKEIGRRVWMELCIQDWFSIPFSECYLIHHLSFNTQKPLNCREEDMRSLTDEIPTTMTYHRLLYDIAHLMPQLQDDLVQSNTLYTKYEHVLRYDRKMRTLASQKVPLCLMGTPLDQSWPRYIPWARHCLAISSAHKIIMIHRKFLWSSFSNPVFAFTRKTCIAASKTIIREYKKVANEDGPILWIYHAFSVAAAIILCLDLLFCSPAEAEHQGHRGLVHDTIELLSDSQTSMIAQRGVTILRLLLQAQNDRTSVQIIGHQRDSETTTSGNDQLCALDIKKLVQAVCDQESHRSRESFSCPSADELPTSAFSPSTINPRRVSREGEIRVDRNCTSGSSVPSRFIDDSDLFGNLLGPQSKFEIHDSLEDILFLAQNCSS